MAVAATSAAPKHITFAKYFEPITTIRGGAFAYNKPIDQIRIPTCFQIIAVRGFVKWKDHGSGKVEAALILSRGQHFKTQMEFGRIELTKDARGSPVDDLKKAEFVFLPDKQNSFWHSSSGTGRSHHSF